MGYQQKFESWSLIAAADLSNTTPGMNGALYKAIGMQTRTFVNNAVGAFGLLQEGCSSGGHASVAISGVSKAVFATAITSVGMDLTVTTSGLLTLATSGTYVMGKNLTAVSCVGVHAVMLNALNPWYYNPTENSSGT